MYFLGEPFKAPEIHDYQQHKQPATRSNNMHENCELCRVARVSLIPKTAKQRTSKKKCTKVVKRCAKCATEIGRGKRHICLKSARIKTILELASGVEGQVASNIVKQRAGKEGGVIDLPNLRGKATRVMVNPEKNRKASPIPHERLLDWKTTLNLSGNQVIF